MAEIAQGANCPSCGTFNAFGGSVADKEFAGRCTTCGTSYAIGNPSYDPGVAKIVAEKDAEIAALKQQIADLKGEKPAAAPVVQTPASSEDTEDVDDNPPDNPDAVS